jgi:hypothetical protein
LIPVQDKKFAIVFIEPSNAKGLKFLCRYCLFGAQASGAADRFKGFAVRCMAEYDLNGWKASVLTDPGALSYHAQKR